MTAPDPTPDLPVFRLVADTTSFSQVDRYRLALRVGLITDFQWPPWPLPWSQN